MYYAAASFNGITFHVLTGESEATHRVSTTAVPNGRHVNESFGPGARKYSIEAYFTGAACVPAAEAMVAAAENSHRGLLMLPGAVPALVRLTRASSRFDKDKLGYILVSFEAVAEPAEQGGFSVDLIALRLFSTLAGLPALMGAFAAVAFNLAGRSPGVVVAAQTSAASALADLESVRGALRLDAAQDETLAGPAQSALLALANFPADPAGFGVALGDYALALGDVATPEEMTQQVAEFGPLPERAPPLTSSVTAAAMSANVDAADALATIARCVAVAEAQPRQTFPARAEALEARAVIVALFDDALARLGRGSHLIGPQLNTLLGDLADLNAAQALRLAETITVSAPARLPSLWWSYRLYGTPDRAEELATRAHAPIPARMPARFDAAAV